MEGQNRVLVDLPERLRKAKEALKEAEALIDQTKRLYGQRLVLHDSVVLDQIGELLGCPPLKGDRPSV